MKDLGVSGAFGVPGVHKNSWAVTQTHIPLIQTFQLWEENPAHLRVWPDQTVCEIQPQNNAGGLPVCVDGDQLVRSSLIYQHATSYYEKSS